MDAAKIRLSQEETELVMRSGWILTKNAILLKVRRLLENIQTIQQPLLSVLPSEVRTTSAKISKGENYKGLPYLVLDQPRYFNREDVFAVRTLFWWGHFFSTTLHLAGHYKNRYAATLAGAYESLAKNNFYLCINADPWEHHFDTDNYISLQEITAKRFEEVIRSHSFIKLSGKISLDQWDDAEEVLPGMTKQLLKMLAV